MSDDSKELSRVEDILSGEDYLPKKPMSRVEELLMDGAMVPKVDDTDNGKVLKVIDGEWQPGDDVSGDNLPPVSSLDNGKVLKVVSGEWNIGDDKSESSFVYIGSTYPFSGSKVALPANINNVLIANYTSSPKVPTFLVSSNNIIFEPKEVSISTGTTPSVHIRWGRMYSTFDSATREENIYNDSLSYNTQNQTTEASYFKTKAIQTIPPVDVPDNGKVMQVSGGHWVAELLPEVDGVPQVTSSDIGKVLKATGVNTYGWEKDGSDIIVIRTLDEYPFLNDEVDLSIVSINNLLTAYYNRDLGASSIPIYLMSSNGMLFEPVTNQTVIFDPDEGLSGSMTWSRIIAKTDVSTHKELLFREAITYTITDQNPTGVFTSAEIETGGTDNHAVHIPPVIFDNGELKKIGDLTGFPGIEKVYLTPTAYSNLTTAQKQDLSKIYYVSDYEFHSDPDHPEVVVRIGANNEVKWFFSGYTFANSNRYEVPESLRQYQPNNGTGRVRVDSTPYASASSTEPINQNYFVGWSNLDQANKVRYSSITGSVSILNGTVYAVIDPNGSSGQTNAYSDPYDVPNGFTIYYGNKQYTDFDIPYSDSIARVVSWLGDGYIALDKSWSELDNINDNGSGTANNSAIYVPFSQRQYFVSDKECPIFKYRQNTYPSSQGGTPYKEFEYSNKDGIWVISSDTSEYEGEWDTDYVGKLTFTPYNAGVTPVRLSKTAYDALTPAQKTDPSKMYLIDGSIITDETLISPDDLAADDGMVIGTGATQSNRGAWCCFNGVKATRGFDGAFNPAYNSDPCYVGYHFTDKAHRITKVKYRVFWQGNSGTITNSVYVEGSNDGTNWIDIGGGAVAMSIEESSYSDYEVPCDMNEYSYVRIRFGSAVNVTGSNKFFAVSYMEIYATETAKVYNAICYNGAEYASLDPTHYRREISQTDYDNLPASKNSDGIIYFITDNS